MGNDINFLRLQSPNSTDDSFKVTKKHINNTKNEIIKSLSLDNNILHNTDKNSITSKNGSAQKSVSFIENSNASSTQAINTNHTKLACDVKGTTYYPVDTKMEGGAKAKYNGINLKKHTLEAFMNDPNAKNAFVAIAVDEHLVREGKLHWGEKIRIPEMEKALGSKTPIVFSVVDTGSAFTGGYYDSKDKFHASKKYHAKGFNAIDICAEHKGKYQDCSFPNLTLLKMN